MKREQLSNRIGNIEDRLVEQAENAPNFGHQRRNRSIRRTILIAAVIALMAGSFAVGAVAMKKDPEIIYEVVEEIVYVEKEQEIIVVGDSGISLIFPDSWKGKYGYEYSDSESSYDYIDVYHLATRESFEYGGVLFQIAWVEELYPLDYAYPQAGFTIALTKTHTYRMIYPSDVQVDIHNPEAWAEYDVLYADINNVEIVMTAETLANTINASNWIPGTVVVDFLDEWVTTKTVVCDEEQSRIIREIVEAQDYNLEPGSYFADLWIMFGDNNYLLNLTTGRIRSAVGGSKDAVLSAEDLSTVMDLFID